MTAGAEIGSAACDQAARNDFTATGTGKAGTAVHAEFMLKRTFPAVEIAPVGNGGATARYRPAQHFFRREGDPVPLCIGDPTGGTGGIDAGMMKDLAGVDIADSRDDRLIQEKALDGSLPGPAPRSQVFRREVLEWIYAAMVR